MGVSGQCHALAALPWGKTQCPLNGRLGGPRAGLDGCRKSYTPTGIQSPDCPACSESLSQPTNLMEKEFVR